MCKVHPLRDLVKKRKYSAKRGKRYNGFEDISYNLNPFSCSTRRFRFYTHSTLHVDLHVLHLIYTIYQNTKTRRF